MNTGLSLWALSANRYLSGQQQDIVYQEGKQDFTIQAIVVGNSFWIKVIWPDGAEIAFRPAFSPDAEFELTDIQQEDGGVNVSLKSYAGRYKVNFRFSEYGGINLRYTTTFVPAMPVMIPYWPKDILVLNPNHPHMVQGEVHVAQEGVRTGLVYFSTKDKGGTVFYQQDLTSLNAYCQATETSPGGSVGGTWPELGFSLPITKQKPLTAGEEFIISDAYVVFRKEIPANEFDRAKQYMDLMASVYRKLPQPDTNYLDYPDFVKRSINDIKTNHGCWFQVGNKCYLNAYVCDYKTPPEIMVQLAALLPMVDYANWAGEEVGLEDTLLSGLREFYDPAIGTIQRWLPAAKNNLDKSEEQKEENVMDSWYLHHPLLNLSRLALQGNKDMEKLFLESLEYSIKVAHHFNYQWPVFYNMVTMEVLKAETAPGKGGEKDVAGIYAAVMLQAWELTRKRRYLKEAEKAARSLKRHGLWVFYQANTTAFSAKALLKLYLITKDEYYLDLSYLCIAGIMRNVHIWDCDYGYGKSYPTFFALYPLNDAPYTAAYEEQEVFAALHDYLNMAEDIELLPSVKLLITEFIRHFINRAAYYFPPLLPPEVVADEVKTGEISPELYLALEDLQDGWEKSGSVGQEVYGAGLAFGIAPRHYIKVPEQEFMIYIDYPFSKRISLSKKTASIQVIGLEEFSCRLLIITPDRKFPKGITLKENGKAKELMEMEGYTGCMIKGNSKVTIAW